MNYEDKSAYYNSLRPRTGRRGYAGSPKLALTLDQFSFAGRT